MIHKTARRTRAFRALVTPVGYRAPVYCPTPKAIGPILNSELKEMQAKRKMGGQS